jgi:hypothetical protein
MIRFAFPLLFATACITGEFTDESEPLDDDAAALGGSVPVRVVQHNIEKKMDALQNALKKATSSGAEAITLQEVCPDQLQWLQANYGTRWSIASVQGKKPAITGCDLPGGLHDTPTDVAIWLGGTGGKGKPFRDLGGPAAAPGQMVCLEFPHKKVDVHVCSVHLISADWTDSAGTLHDGATIRERQTTGIKQETQGWINRGDFVIVGGDFNGKPSSPPLDKIYDNKLGGTGNFTEYNRTGAGRDGKDTAHADGDGQPFSRKIDYIFFSTNRAPLDGPAVDIEKDSSDHDMLTSTAQMKKKR